MMNRFFADTNKRKETKMLNGLILGFLTAFLTIDSAWAGEMGVGAAAEWDKAQSILMHTPGEEVLMGVIDYEAALFEDTFSMKEAAEEHQAYIEKLKQVVPTVRTVEEVLLYGVDAAQKNKEYLDLVDLANDMTILDVSQLQPRDQYSQKRKYREALIRLAPEVLVRMVLQRPTVILSYDTSGSKDGGYNVIADYRSNPMMNMYFMRDQMITTEKGVIVGRMARSQRQVENSLARFILKKLEGIDHVKYIQQEIAAPGTLEGGDFIPAGNRVFIGTGLRTNEAAVKQLLAGDAFGNVDEVIVVKDEWHNQQEMHLDTYFNIIDHNLAVLVKGRTDPNCTVQTNNKCLSADVFKRERGGYTLHPVTENFVKVLKDRGYTIIPVSEKDQELYGINFLTISGRNIFAVDDGCSPVERGGKDKCFSAEYLKNLENHHVKITWINFSNMKKGYGAAHCTTQVLWRSAKER